MALGGLFSSKYPLDSEPAINTLFSDKSISGKFDFEISLAEFSFAGQLMSGKISNMDFPARAKNEFGINVLEYVSGFFNEKHTDSNYMKELKKRCDDLGLKNNLIMVDGANIADPDDPSSGYMPDNEGIKATKALLERVKKEMV